MSQVQNGDELAVRAGPSLVLGAKDSSASHSAANLDDNVEKVIIVGSGAGISAAMQVLDEASRSDALIDFYCDQSDVKHIVELETTSAKLGSRLSLFSVPSSLDELRSSGSGSGSGTSLPLYSSGTLAVITGPIAFVDRIDQQLKNRNFKDHNVVRIEYPC